MSKQFVCDVCGEPFSLEQPHLEIVVQEDMEGPAPAGEYDVCTWECLYDLAKDATGETEREQMETTALGKAIMDSAEIQSDYIEKVQAMPIMASEVDPNAQIVVDQSPRPQFAKETEDAGVGTWFPDGMRVDGRTPTPQRRVRLNPVAD